MKFCQKFKNAFEHLKHSISTNVDKLNRGTKIGICSIVAAALILFVVGIVHYNSNQKETASTGDIATCPVGITVSKAEKDRSTGCKINAEEDNKSKEKDKESKTKQADKNDKEEKKGAAAATATQRQRLLPSQKRRKKNLMSRISLCPISRTANQLLAIKAVTRNLLMAVPSRTRQSRSPVKL